MKILFVACYVNNAIYMQYTKKYLDKYLVNCTYDYVCLNDAPDVENGEENYIQACDIMTGENNCYSQIKKAADKYEFIHIKIPQNIHIKNRPNHSSCRHSENIAYFNENIETLIPNFTKYDYLCYIDSDCFLGKYIDLKDKLKNHDIVAPMIYPSPDETPELRYPHVGLFFINLKTVTNFKDLNPSIKHSDTGSGMVDFIHNNLKYRIKETNKYNGWWDYEKNTLWIPDGETVMELDVVTDNVKTKIIDSWFDKSFYHLRGGSCFSIGSSQHRDKHKKNVQLLKTKLEALFALFEV